MSLESLVFYVFIEESDAKQGRLQGPVSHAVAESCAEKASTLGLMLLPFWISYFVNKGPHIFIFHHRALQMT